MFRGNLRRAVNEASASRKFERAFANDVSRALPQLGTGASGLAQGLVASVNFHNRKHENEKTAADIGIVICRPEVSTFPSIEGEASHWRISKDQRRGLLAQAKVGSLTGVRMSRTKWGRLKPSQNTIIPERIKYFCMLLYRYTDPARHVLGPFEWQLCNKHNVDDVAKWLKTDKFPEKLSSEQILRKLSLGQIGTANQKVIESIIDAQKTGYMEIRIYWKDGMGPPSQGHVRTNNPSRLQQRRPG